MKREDDFDPQRFLDAQEPCYAQAIAELAEGRKRSHWMWFIFPQLRGLGRSPTALYFGLAGRDAAGAYARHPLLGPRLRRATEAARLSPTRSLALLFGAPDDLKFISCMTLFETADPAGPYREARLGFGAEPDPQTLRRIADELN